MHTLTKPEPACPSNCYKEQPTPKEISWGYAWTRGPSQRRRQAQSAAGVRISADDATLEGAVTVPGNASKLVLFAHGSGSSRHSPRNRFVAQKFNDAGLATLLFDLLTREEEAVDLRTAQYRFDIGLLAQRLLHATHWARQYKKTRQLRFSYFGASTGGAATLVAAAELSGDVGPIVSRGGRPDLARDALPRVRAPTLLIVGGEDDVVIDLTNRHVRKCVAK